MLVRTIIWARWIEVLDLSFDVVNIGTARDKANQFNEVGVHFLSDRNVCISRRYEVIKASPDVVHMCKESRSPAVNGQKVCGDSLVKKCGSKDGILLLG